MTSYEERLKQFAQADDLPRLSARQAVEVGLWVAGRVEEPLGVAMVPAALEPLGVEGAVIVADILAVAADSKDPHASDTPRRQQGDAERVEPAEQGQARGS